MQLTQTRADDLSWFHGMQLNEIRTRGRVNPDNWSLYPMLAYMEETNLTGVRALDIGTMDGLVSFIMEEEGATEVHSTDLYERETFSLARDHLGLGARYHPKTSIESLIDKFGSESFDVLVMGGLLYHLVSPLRAVMNARHLMRTGGLLFLETVCSRDDEPVLRFNLSDPIINEYTTYFVPSISAVKGMLNFALFDVVRVGSIAPANGNYTRTTFVARAVGLDDCVAQTELMGDAIKRGSRSVSDQILDEFSFAKLKFEDHKTISTISKNNVVDTFSPTKFETRFRLQPRG